MKTQEEILSTEYKKSFRNYLICNKEMTLVRPHASLSVGLHLLL